MFHCFNKLLSVSLIKVIKSVYLYLSNMIVRSVGNAFETNVKGTKKSEQASDKPGSTASGLERSQGFWGRGRRVGVGNRECGYATGAKATDQS